MKRETKEYPFDWMLWSSVMSGSKVQDGTRKEYQALLRVIPHFSRVIDLLMSQGETGRLFMKRTKGAKSSASAPSSPPRPCSSPSTTSCRCGPRS